MKAGVRLLLVVAAPVLAGCSVLLPYLDPYGSYPYTDPYFSEPTVPKTFDRGKATIEFTQGGQTQTLTLNEVAPGSTYDAYLGAMVTWENDEGWVVSITAYNSTQMPDFLIPGVNGGDVTVSRIEDHEYWTAGSYTSWATGNNCVVDVWELSDAKVEGRVNCRQLRWTDGINPYSFDAPAFVEGQDAFDVSITFEAEPSGLPPGSTS